MLEGFVLGAIQGITEWLPISSEAAIILVKTNFFGGGESFGEQIELALFLHLGTFFAAAWYLREDVIALLKLLVTRPQTILQEGEMQGLFRFLFVTTIVSGLLGYPLIKWGIPLAEQHLVLGTKAITGFVGILLLGTAFAQWQAKRRQEHGQKQVGELDIKDSVLLGVVQGFTALPGFSRSGFTISALLLRGYADTTALRASFLMSLPIVLGGNIVLQLDRGISFELSMLFGLISSFIFGILTIHILFRLAKRINFAYFVLIFGLVTLASLFIP